MLIKLLKRYDVLFVIVAFLLAIPAERKELLAFLEDPTITLRHQLRMAYGDREKLSFSRDIVLVNVDEKFFHYYKSFPLRRTDVGKITANLKALGAKVIAIDMLMDFPSSYGEDEPLAQALTASGNTLLVAQAVVKDGKVEKVNLPTGPLDQASLSAYTNITSTTSFFTTLSRLHIHGEATGMRGGWPFAVQAAAMYLGVEPTLEPGLLRLGELAVPLDENNNLYIDFPPLPTGTRFLSESAGITALDFLDISDLDETELQELRYWVDGKIVVVGDTSEVSHDWFDTPVGMVYGVEIIADTINTILNGGPLQAASPAAESAVIIVIMLLLVALALAFTNPWHRAGGVLLVSGGYIAAMTVAYVHQGVAFSMAPVLVAGTLGYLLIEFRQYLLERNQKQQITKVFGQYIPAELVDEMRKTGQTVSVGGEAREMTVLFSDVRGFTSISEGMAPQELTTLMNAFLSPMTRVIHKNRGTIDKYMGDAIMAFWGAPLRDPDHARHAVQAALAMVRTMEELGDEFRARGWKPLKIGIGLNTGVMNVGNMGSDFRLAYTVLGDSVNLGSRIESLTKQYGVQVMISEFTQAVLPDLISRQMDLVRVKGKELPVGILEPVGFPGEVDEQTLDRINRHHAAIALYRARDFAAARAAFAALAGEEPGRLIYQVYLSRIDHFLTEPPGEDWDGVFTHKEK